MAKSPKKRVKRKEAEAVEVRPDAWGRFKEAVNMIMPPKRGRSLNKPVIKKGVSRD